MSRRPRRSPGPRPAAGVGRGWVAGAEVRVELAGHTARLGALRAHPERYASWFAAARRRPGHGICRCTRSGERLVIREIAGVFHLARWPRSGDNHRPGCPFFTADSRHSGAHTGPTRAAITVSAHGTRIAVDYAFSTALPDPSGDDLPPQTLEAELLGGARPQTATMTGLGLLHWLWETSGLNTWPPTADPDTPDPPASARDRRGERSARPRRSWRDVHDALQAVLGALRLGDHPAPSLAYVVAPYRPGVPDPARDARLTQFLRPLEHPEQVVIRGGPRRGHTRTLRHRRLLLAELKHDPAAAEHGQRLALRHFPRPVFLTAELGAHLTRRFPAAFSDRRGPRSRRIVLALVEGTAHGYLRLVDAAVMLTTSDYLPADSSHEARLAEHLVASGREFTKPLRYGREDTTLPDFVLTDTDPATVIEVWGITGRADYEQRRRTKLEHYAAEGTPVIAWDVTSGPPPPVRARPDR